VIALRSFIFFVICVPCFANPALDALRTTLVAMRGKPPDSGGLRGATPQLTVAKHQLRDWVESQLKGFPRDGDEGELQRKLNPQLRDAGLFCGEDAADRNPCPDLWTLNGFLSDLTLRRSGVFLILQTGIGIECGFDESAYLYAWSNEGWRRVWQTEQNTYKEKEYKPQTIRAVLISPHNKTNDYLVLTLGTNPWCTSNWHSVYYRAFRLGPDPTAEPPINGAEIAYLGNDPAIEGSVTQNEVLVEYAVRSIDARVHNRQAIRHYSIDGGSVRRIDPLALSPRDFVDEWLTHDWREAAFWSESEHRRSALDWHNKLHKEFVAGDFIYPTMHCSATPDLWQVGIDFRDSTRNYFLVRWRPPFHFSMVNISDHPWPDCTAKDPQADEPRTRFPR
jgi:hypothetical protein